jgi:8-oxo-dGTP pyrophosphatase MutT (NUDIX family)
MTDDNKEIRTCAGFVVLCDGKVLLVETPNHVWGFPKGKKNKKEELMKCAYRELEEETGLKKDQINVIPDVVFEEISKKGKSSVHLYLATTCELIKPRVQDQEELLTAQWINVKDACSMLTKKNRRQILIDAVDTYKRLTS